MGQQHNSTDKKIWLGLFLVVIGGFWMLDNLNIIPYYIPDVLISWKTFLIALGVYFIVGRGKPEAGIIMIAIGGVFLFQDLDFFYIRDIWHLFWPAVIIAVGISMIVRRTSPGGVVHSGSNMSGTQSDIDFLDDFAIFGGGEKTINTNNFRGGKLTAMFGGSEIDLRPTDLSEGVNVLDVFIMFGGTGLIVPPDWTIKVEVFSIFGGFSDSRTSALKVVPNPDKVLIVKGFVMFGGGSISLNK